MAKVLLPIPQLDFDPSEVAITWQVLTLLGHEVSFATPNGRAGAGDGVMLSGRGLDPWEVLPFARDVAVVGLALRANAAGRSAYAQLIRNASFNSPLTWDKASAKRFDGIVVAGGHRARGMRPYLESDVLQRLIVNFFRAEKPVGAICHGVLLAARSVDPSTKASVLHGRRTTALTWTLEQSAWELTRRTRFWDPNYYRTYVEDASQPAGYMSVQAEVTRALARPEDFRDAPGGSFVDELRKRGLVRDTFQNERPAWVVRDGTYVSARWPGDVHTFAKTFSQVLNGD
ncbi:MAG: type 1 glutamine amidotransferase domain-containing protein [Acidimicrobiales bacterium]